MGAHAGERQLHEVSVFETELDDEPPEYMRRNDPRTCNGCYTAREQRNQLDDALAKARADGIKLPAVHVSL